MAEENIVAEPAAEQPVAAPAAPTTAPAAAPAAAPSVLAATDAPATPAAPAADDWAAIRTRIAGDNEKMLKQLSRYGTLEEFARSAVETKEKLSKTRSEAKPGKDATPEELAAYREANGVPESPDKYELNLPNGIVLGDADAPYVEAFTAIAHKHNLTPDVVNDIAAAQLEMRETEIQERAQADVQSKIDCDAKLRSPDVWGSETNLNINMITGMLDGAPQGVKEQLVNARLADGTPLGNHVPTLQWLATVARELNPIATVVPGSGANAQQALESEIAKLDGMMADFSSEYHKGPNAEKNQARYRELIDVRMKLAK